MTVKELMAKLKEFPQDMKVVTRGYEDGYEDPVFVDKISIHLDVYFPRHYNGNHQEHETENCYCLKQPDIDTVIKEVVSISE